MNNEISTGRAHHWFQPYYIDKETDAQACQFTAQGQPASSCFQSELTWDACYQWRTILILSSIIPTVTLLLWLACQLGGLPLRRFRKHFFLDVTPSFPGKSSACCCECGNWHPHCFIHWDRGWYLAVGSSPVLSTFQAWSSSSCHLKGQGFPIPTLHGPLPVGVHLWSSLSPPHTAFPWRWPGHTLPDLREPYNHGNPWNSPWLPCFSFKHLECGCSGVVPVAVSLDPASRGPFALRSGSLPPPSPPWCCKLRASPLSPHPTPERLGTAGDLQAKRNAPFSISLFTAGKYQLVVLIFFRDASLANKNTGCPVGLPSR